MTDNNTPENVPSPSDQERPRKQKTTPKPNIALSTIRANIATRMDANGLSDPSAIRAYLQAHPEHDRTIGDLELNLRASNAIEGQLGITSVLQLLHCTEAELRAVPNVGEKALEEIFSALAAIGLTKPSSASIPDKPTKTSGTLTLDPVLNAHIKELEQLAHAEQPDANHAERICSLSRDIRFRLGCPWHHEPAFVDSIAERLSDAVASIKGTQESPLIRRYATNTLQRMIFILQDKHGKASMPWLSRLEALQDDAQVSTVA